VTPVLLGLYRGATRLALPLARRHLQARARRGKEDPARLEERLGTASKPRPGGPLVWLHAASVGESLSLLPLIEALRAGRPSLSLLLTTGTVTSARLMEDRLPEGVLHQFAPLDLPGAHARFLDHWRPDLALIVESELWPNLILAAGARGLPLALVNARMSERSFRRWRLVPGPSRRLLAGFTLCLAQSEADAARLRALGALDVRVPGNLKHAAPPLAVDPHALAALGAALGERPVWLAASTHPGEEEMVAAAQRRLLAGRPDLLAVIVPRHPARGSDIAAMLAADGLAVTRRGQGGLPGPGSQVYVADTLGELGLFYRVAACAFIGGSLVRHGGQNPLEAARLGCPPLFGPHMDNFPDIAALLLQARGAIRVEDADDLALAVAGLLDDPAARGALAQAAQAAAAAKTGVLARVLGALAPLLDRAALACA
jgi:3-deoxy-D-manno-octulosonic-acid transferase